MEKYRFYKFDGAGNDFILFDTREHSLSLDSAVVSRLCRRRLGIGADGLILLSCPRNEGSGFAMTYYNSDGSRADMCGNGGRCIAMFAHLLGLSQEGAVPHVVFDADDGTHKADINLWDGEAGMGVVRLSMRDVRRDSVRKHNDGWLIDTGVPHFVQRVKGLPDYDVASNGRAIRYDKGLGEGGANVDFIEDREDGTLYVRTYERGVEGETWACGTGVTAAAIISGNKRIHTKGGDFRVDFDVTETHYADVWLTGPVSLNFIGEVAL